MIEMKPFRFWCKKVIPLIYDDSLSYYELLCKVIDYLNKVIENENEQNEAIKTLQYNFNVLKKYVDDYFTNMDVQEEINNKLDDMAASGALSDLIRDYLGEVANVKALGNMMSIDEAKNYISANLIVCGDIAESVLMIDCGAYPEEAGEITAYNQFLNGVDHVTDFVISHYHRDHAGGFKYVCETLGSGVEGANIYLPPAVNRNVITSLVVSTLEDEVLELAHDYNMNIIRPVMNHDYPVTDVVKLNFFNTNHDYYYNLQTTDYNDCCLVTDIKNGNTTILFPADITKTAQHHIAPYLKKQKIAYMAHHGTNVDIDSDYFYAICPDTYIVQNGNGNSVSLARNYINKYSAENFIAQERDINVFATSNNEDYTVLYSFNSFNYDFKALVLPNDRTGHEYYSLTDWTQKPAAENRLIEPIEFIEQLPNNSMLLCSLPHDYISSPNLGKTANVLGIHFKTNSGSSVNSYNTGSDDTENIFYYLGLYMRNLYGKASDFIAVHASRQGEYLEETDYSITNLAGLDYDYFYTNTINGSDTVAKVEFRNNPYYFGDSFTFDGTDPDHLTCVSYGLYEIDIMLYSASQIDGGAALYEVFEYNGEEDTNRHIGFSGFLEAGQPNYMHGHGIVYVEEGNEISVKGYCTKDHSVRILLKRLSKSINKNKANIFYRQPVTPES